MKFWNFEKIPKSGGKNFWKNLEIWPKKFGTAEKNLKFGKNCNFGGKNVNVEKNGKIWIYEIFSKNFEIWKNLEKFGNLEKNDIWKFGKKLEIWRKKLEKFKIETEN